MKQNAILVAAIMFISGCATHQGGYGHAQSGSDSGYQYSSYDTTHPITTSAEVPHRDATGRMSTPVVSDPATSTQYDPAASFSASAGTEGPEFDADSSTEITVDDSLRDVDMADENQARLRGRQVADHEIRADSSIRGGSDRARGWNLSGNEVEPQADPINPRFQADSSIRGGSDRARDREWSQKSGSLEPGSSSSQIKADSSIRGGSDRARGFDQSSYRSGNFQSRAGDSSIEMDLQSDIMSDSRSAQMNAGLNSSENLEENISGRYDLDEQQADQHGELQSTSGLAEMEMQTDRSADASIQTQGVGAAATTERGQSSSNLESQQNANAFTHDPAAQGSEPSSQVGVTKNDPQFFYKNNPAHGVGSAARLETGTVSGQQQDLAQQVKSTLAKESTGTHGLLRHDVVQNIEVSSQGGVVTLTGSVPTEQDKRIVGIRAGEIKGVDRVDNQLTVNPAANPANRDLSTGHDLEEITDQQKE